MITKWKWMSALLVLGGASAAQAESPYAWHEDGLKSRVGIGLTLGGGVAGFTDQATRTALDSKASGLWDFRVAFGTHIPVGIELGYIGSATTLNQSGTSDRTLVGTTAEAAVRYNILPHEKWNPYAFAGAGWQRYDVTGSSLSQTNMKSDNLAVFPLGVGIGYRDPGGLTVDARGTVRVAQSSDLVLDSNGNRTNLHTWEASGSVGYEF